MNPTCDDDWCRCGNCPGGYSNWEIAKNALQKAKRRFKEVEKNYQRITNIDKDKPIRRRVTTIGYGRVSVYEDIVHGDMVPLVVVDSDGNQVPNDYYDLEDIRTLDPRYSA